jgi:hypothetical protein
MSVLAPAPVSVTRPGFAVITGAREIRSELLPDALWWGAARSVGAVSEYMATHATRTAITDRTFGSTDQLRRRA